MPERPLFFCVIYRHHGGNAVKIENLRHTLDKNWFIMEIGMDRRGELVSLIDYDSSENFLIEPPERDKLISDVCFSVISENSPAVIVKAGLGSGRLAIDIASRADSYFVIVEPSFEAVKKFKARYASDPALEKINFIIGDFYNFPVDYYCADFLICNDIFEFIETGKAVDEFRIALQFDGLFFISTPVLDDRDFDGCYDDLMKKVFPLHNDFYMEDDLKTFMDLNELVHVKSSVTRFERDISRMIGYFVKLYGTGASEAAKYLDENSSAFSGFYSSDGKKMSEPYFAGLFRRKNPDKKA